MDARKLLAAYPNAAVAVAYTELIICGDAHGKAPNSAWEMMMAAHPPLSVQAVWELIRKAMEGETACRAAEALAQTDHPEYMTYLRGKMGMM